MAEGLTKYQRLVAKHYCQGEFNHIQSVEAAEFVGDTLFLFLLREVDDDCGDDVDFCRRLERASEDIMDCLGEAAEDLYTPNQEK